MEEGFVNANPSNLPEIDMFERQTFISQNKSGAERYGDDAVGYVQVKREGSTCILKGRIVPEHKVHKKPYHVEMLLEEFPGKSSRIKHVKCLSCVSSEGFCKHAYAFLCWVARRTYDKACTSVTSYWTKPKLVSIGDTTRKASDMGKKRKKVREPTPDVTNFKARMFLESNNQLRSADNFLHFVVNYYTADMISKIEEETREQYLCSAWSKIKCGRVTASILHETAQCKTSNGVLKAKIFGAKSVFLSPAMERGIKLEAEVKKVLEQEASITISESGTFIHPLYPAFAASPDGVTEELVVEVKCPSSHDRVSAYIDVKSLQPKEKFYSQIQLQMLMSNRNKGLFAIASPDFEKTQKIQHICQVSLDLPFNQNKMEKALQYWKKEIFPMLMV
ncbi:hypothetical protein B566_EDAN016958 [Ephemera danica]|nr:hypothetical protein B566_EDAN016958 [Ephemera danica]